MTDQTSTFVTLTLARALIEKGWTQGALARDAQGNRLTGGACDPETGEPRTPVAWCAYGAICAATPGAWNESACYGARGAASSAVAAVVYGENGAGRGLGVWNDKAERTKDEVLAAFDAAIASIKG